MSIVIGIPILLFLIMFQSAVVSGLPLLSGTADIVLLALVAWSLQERVRTAYEWAVIGGLLCSVITRLPFLIPVLGYLAAAFVARFLRRQVWQTPFFVMFITTFVGTLIYHILTWVVLVFQGVPLPLFESINLVLLPSALLNLVLALPVYAIITDLANSIYPEEAET